MSTHLPFLAQFAMVRMEDTVNKIQRTQLAAKSHHIIFKMLSLSQGLVLINFLIRKVDDCTNTPATDLKLHARI